ncbi:MAG: hypothetical protein JWM11_3349 [Planctomycetaceae bacterium]|nr:hypothetical protein [Planctomycetaceae bacterium]
MCDNSKPGRLEHAWASFISVNRNGTSAESGILIVPRFQSRGNELVMCLGLNKCKSRYSTRKTVAIANVSLSRRNEHTRMG